MQRLSLLLARATTQIQAAEILLRETISALGATGGAIFLLDDDGMQFQTVASFGFPDEVVRQFEQFPTGEEYPACDAVRERTPLFFETYQERMNRYPGQGPVASAGQGALATLPLLTDDTAIGAMRFIWTRNHLFPPEERGFLLSTAEIGAITLQRTRLYDERLQEIRDLRQSQAELLENESRFRTLFTSIDEGYCLCEMIVDVAGQPVDYRFLEVNPLFETMTGLMDAVGRTAYEMIPGLERVWVETYARVGLGGEKLRFENGSEVMGRWFDVFATPVEPHGRFALVFKDITERKRAQVAVQDLNLRLQRAVAESHHRIKNNLQVLSALVDLIYLNQEESISKAELERVANHISALATLHDLLTLKSRSDTDGLNTVSLKTVLERLQPLAQTAAGERPIVFELTGDLSVPLKQASSFVLLVNELITNAVKHGQGSVCVRLSVDGDNADKSVDGTVALTQMGRLEVSDDGPGFRPSFNPASGAHTGIELIESLGRWDLHGEVQYGNRPEGGGRVIVTFPIPSNAELPETENF